MKKLIAKKIDAFVAQKTEDVSTFKWVLGSVEIPKDKKKEAK